MDGADRVGEPVTDILRPTGDRGPGVVVAHAWWGLNQTIRDYGAALTAEGFVVALPDLFDGAVATSVEEAEALVSSEWPAPEGLRAAIEELSRHEAVTGTAVGAVAFSYSGFHLLGLVGNVAELRAPVVYYATRYDRRLEPGSAMAHLAAEDDFEGEETMAALVAQLGEDYAFQYPGTRHWFAEPDRPEYDEPAAMLAFQRTVGLLRERLG